MSPKLRLSLALAACLLLMTIVVLPTIGFQGFHDDTEDPCFGDSDPFCGGGGGGGSCYICSSDLSTNPPDIRCIDGSAGSTCTVTHHPNGDIDCAATGTCS